MDEPPQDWLGHGLQHGPGHGRGSHRRAPARVPEGGAPAGARGGPAVAGPPDPEPPRGHPHFQQGRAVGASGPQGAGSTEGSP
eukprot:606080-Pyramimonas_sp.AAC.1